MDNTLGITNDFHRRTSLTNKKTSDLIVDSVDRPSSSRYVSENCVTTVPSSSRFKNLFSRKKSSPTEDLRPLNAEPVPRPTTSAASQHYSLGDTGSISGQLSRKDTIVSRRSQHRSNSRSRRRVSPSSRESIQPLSLAEAYAQASLDSTLQVPSKSFRDWLPLSTGRSTSRRQSEISSDLIADDSRSRSPSKTDIENPTSDVRTSNSYQLTDKLFLLCDHGTIFQYKIDGQSNRLPEKSFKILPESVAFASDAIAGKHWVLDISVSSNNIEDSKNTSSWSNWSKLSFRNTEAKKAIESLLIVFDNPELMSTWLAAIRREIDLLGGLSYRPVTPQINQECKTSTRRDVSGERASLRTSFLRFSRSASNLRNELYDPSRTEKDLPRLPVPSTSSHQMSISGRSVAASSIATTTSLDRLKDPDTGSTTTAATNSLDGSIALESPIKAAFADISGPVPSIETRSSMLPERLTMKDVIPVHTFSDRQKHTVIQSHRRTASNSSTNQSRPQLQTIDSESSLSNSSPQDKPGEGPTRLDVPRPISVLMPLPSVNGLKKPSPTQQFFPSEIITNLPQYEMKRPASSYNSHTSKLSIDSQAKSMYSLFPKKLVTEVKTEPLIVLEANRIPGLSLHHATDHLVLPPSPIVAYTPSPVSLSSRSNPVKRPSALKLLKPLEVEQPERSPAVSADMLASNFGTSTFGLDPSPISPTRIRVPSFEDLRMFILRDNKMSVEESATTSRSPTDKDFPGVKRQKSTPNLQSTSSRAPSAPVGPPPKRPLPAVPATYGSIAPSLTGSDGRRRSIQVNHQNSFCSPSSQGAPRPQSSYKRPRSKSQAGKNSQAEHSSHTSITHAPTPPPACPPRRFDDSFGIPSVVYRLDPERLLNNNGHQYAPSSISIKSNKSLRQK